MKQILSIARKEMEGYFGSLLAIIFLGTFLMAVLFIFFTVETFFGRGIADVRPLFEWMPILLIFLLAALTMRQWSEEQRSGTLEILLTMPVKLWQLVAGKFIAVMGMILVALAFTLPLPVMVSLIGNLDWGPVFGGYLASILMAGAYAAIGLFISSRTDNQIVALISTALLGGIFYLVGTPAITNFTAGELSEILWALGTGSRFESIQRGVVDVRDLVYYLSLTGLFLAANVLSLDSMRWSEKQTAYRTSVLLTAGLAAANIVLLNVWLHPMNSLRVDLTSQKEFTISPVTRDLLENLQEPLVMRGYISEDTHPLLSPLIPEIKDMLREYEIASNGMVTADVVDPISDPEIESEANQTYGINPNTFQVEGRYETRVINSYFNILVRYGDQSVILNYSDLIEFQPNSSGATVGLRNLEYDLTSAIKKVVYGFQSVDAVLAEMETPAKLTLYLTPDTLPEQLLTLKETIEIVAGDIAGTSNGKFVFEVIDPSAGDSAVSVQQLQEEYGITPYLASFFSNDTFFMHLLLTNGDKFQVIYPTENLTEAEVRTSIESALKRTTSGFLKVAGIWYPADENNTDMWGNYVQPLSSYQLVTDQLGQDYSVQIVDLSSGAVPASVDTLVMIAPRDLSELELYAVDQFLMRGGSLILAASNYKVDFDQMGASLVLQPVSGGLKDLLAHYGVDLPYQLVMDPRNTAFPYTINRTVGDFQIPEVRAIDYPFFVDVRSDGMSGESPIVTNLTAVTMNWASPLEFDSAAGAGKNVDVLLKSSPESWLREDLDIQPDFDTYPEFGFETGETRQSYPLAVSITGSFESYFKDKPVPTAEEETSGLEVNPEADSGQETQIVSTIESSPDSSRLVVIGSSTFVDDFVLQLTYQLYGEQYLNSLNFLKNAVDWSLEDEDLLSIRSRGTAVRVLNAMPEGGQTGWETANYVIALLLLVGLYLFWQYKKRNEQPLELLPVEDLLDENSRQEGASK